jgi:hypothetical protein
LPDEITLSVSSYWAPVVGTEFSSFVNWAVQGKLQSQYLTAHAWRGSGPLTLQLPLHFFATYDAEKEVIAPIRTLVKMALPQATNSEFGVLPPGPRSEPGVIKKIKELNLPGANYVFQSGKADEIQVFIGNFLRLTSVFIPGVPSVSFRGKLSPDGLPMEGVCITNFQTLYAPVADNIDFYMPKGHSQGLGGPIPPVIS